MNFFKKNLNESQLTTLSILSGIMAVIGLMLSVMNGSPVMNVLHPLLSSLPAVLSVISITLLWPAMMWAGSMTVLSVALVMLMKFKHWKICLIGCLLAIGTAYYWIIFSNLGQTLSLVNADYCGEKARCYGGDQLFGGLIMLVVIFLLPGILGTFTAFGLTSPQEDQVA